MDDGQPTYLTKLRKKEKPCGPAGNQQIGSRAPIAGRDGPGPGRGGEGREWRTGERECENEGTGASAERTQGRERECVRVRASDALAIVLRFCRSFVFWVTFSLCVCASQKFLCTCCLYTLAREKQRVFYFSRGLVWFGLPCAFLAGQSACSHTDVFLLLIACCREFI